MIELPPEQRGNDYRRLGKRRQAGVRAQEWLAGAFEVNSHRVEQWRDASRSRIAREDDPHMLQRLGTLGTWPVVLVDLILLLVVEFMLSFVLLFACIAVIAVHDRDFSRGLATSDAMTTVMNSAKDWSLSPTGLAIGEFVTAAGILFVLFVRVIRPRFMTWADLGFGSAMRNRPLRACAAGIGLGVVALIAGDLVVFIVHSIGLNTSGQEDTLKSVHHSSLVTFLPFVLAAAVIAPIVEETFFRGYVFRVMSVRYGFASGLACSSVMFGALHLLGGVTWEAVGLVAIGAVLAYGYSRMGNPITNMTAHMLNNVIGLIVLYYSNPK